MKLNFSHPWAPYLHVLKIDKETREDFLDNYGNYLYSNEDNTESLKELSSIIVQKKWRNQYSKCLSQISSNISGD